MNTIQVALDKIVEKAVPVTISWERDRILEFLSKQYSEGNPKAEELLKLQLWLDVQEKIDTGAITGENTDSQVRDLIGSINGFPTAIEKMVFDDHVAGVRRFDFNRKRCVKGEFLGADFMDADSEDIPF